MAFYPFKGDMAAYHEVNDALTTLYSFLQGQAKNDEVVADAPGYLEQRFGIGVLMGCHYIRKALKQEDQTARGTTLL